MTDAYSLIGDPPGQGLYRSLGFTDVSPSLGMAMRAVPREDSHP